MVALAFVSLPGILYHYESLPDILYHFVPLPFSALLEMAGGRGGGPDSQGCTHTTYWCFCPMRRRPLVSCVSGIVKYADCAASWQIRMPSAHWALPKPIVLKHS